MRTSVWIQNGKVINVGPWDYVRVNGVATNNPPPDAVETTTEIARTADDRIVLASDYQALREAEYPEIPDQLDALWQGGTAAADMKAKVDAVKAKYPKP